MNERNRTSFVPMLAPSSDPRPDTVDGARALVEGFKALKRQRGEVGVGGVGGEGGVTSLVPVPPTKLKRAKYEVIGDCHAELMPTHPDYARKNPSEKNKKTFIDLCHLHQTDKWKYSAAYAALFADFEPKTILEFGIAGGASLHLWKSLFPTAEITGVDSSISRYAKIPAGVTTIEGRQEDPAILRQLTQTAWDLIIDDAGHVPVAQKVTFNALRHNAKVYVIEDVRPQDATTWPDGKTIYDSEATDEKFIVYRGEK